MQFETDTRFKRRLKRKPQAEQEAILECIARVAENPRHPSLHTKPLSVAAPERIFYARVSHANRLTFHRDGPNLVFRNNCNHDEVLRNP